MNTSLYGGIIEISPDGQPISPSIVLAYRSGEKQGIIQNVQTFIQANHLNTASEISFDVHKGSGNNLCALWDEIKDFKLVYVPHLGDSSFNPWYELSVTIDESNETVKHCQATHVQESELSQLLLNDFQVNTEDDIARDDYVPTVLYDPANEDGSLLHRMLKDKATHYAIFHVDSSLIKQQRTFTWNGVAITDAFKDIATELECLFVYGESAEDDGLIHRTVSVYDLNDYCYECGERGTFSNGVCTKCGSANIKYGYGDDTGIFLNSENFADNITYSSNKDEIKNCFRLVAGDELMTATVRNINPSGSQYIWYLSDSMRADMSQALRNKLSAYDTLYESYENDKVISIPQSAVDAYNGLINKYKLYDSSLTPCSYPIVGYSALADLYYNALSFYSLLKTTLAPLSELGVPTTATEEIKKLTVGNLSPLGVSNAETVSETTVNSLLLSYAKVYIDTSLYRLTMEDSSYSNKVWSGRLTLTSFTDDSDTATTPLLAISISDQSAEFLRCQIEKTMKKNDIDASFIVSLFDKDDAAFVSALSFYSIDNLNILANVARGCMDVLIQQGQASPTADLYTTMYLPYYNKNEYIQSELRERETEVLVLRGSSSKPTGILDYVEKQRRSISEVLDLRSYLGESLWVEFCSYRRDDTYRNENFISDGLSDSELISQAQEFIKNAKREIVKSATMEHTINCNLNNFLLVREQDAASSPVPIVTMDNIYFITNDTKYLVKGDSVFSPLIAKFTIGNWLHIEIDDSIYKLRMTDYEINYDSLQTINVNFSDITYGSDSVSDVRSILAQAQSMATSYHVTQRQASKGNTAKDQITNMVENGLDLTNKRIVNSADNQTMLVDDTGLLMRARNDNDDDYNAEQVKIINHGLYYTNDNWRTVQTGVGKFIYFDPETGKYQEDYGLIAHKIVGNIIIGNDLGIYNESGSFKVDEHGVTITSDEDSVNPDLLTIRRKNSDGSYTRYVYIDNEGNIKINGRHIQMSTSEDLPTYIENVIKREAAALVVQLTNEYIGVSTDSSGAGGVFTNCNTSVIVFSGSTDITGSADVKWTITATSGITGSWDSTNHVYSVSALSTDYGEVVFDIEYNGLTASKKFRVTKVKNGADGEKGLPGDSEFVHIKYSAVEHPTDSQMTETPSTYIGICVDKNETDPSTASSYTWSRFIGKDGSDGTPGANGYVHFAYATSADGSENFSTTEFVGATYIGVYSDSTQADSTDYRDYAWSLFKGADGDSISIISTEIAYIPSDDGINPPNAYSIVTGNNENIVDDGGNEIVTNTWLPNIPSVVDGSYLWARTTVNYSDGTSTVTFSVARQGIDGTSGRDGIDGKDGKDGTSNYVHIKYSVYPNPTDDQITEVPSDYIGVCVNNTIADPNTASSYTWSKFRGADGDDGIPGADGWVHFAYATSADGSQDFSPHEFTGATYIGVYSDHTQADSTDYRDYAWSLIKGDKGDKGDQGIPGQNGVGIQAIVEYYAVNNDSSTAPADASFSPTVGQMSVTNRYLWNYEVVTYTDSSSTPTQKRIIGVWGNTGNNGTSITGVTNYYLAYASSTGVTRSTSGWTDTVQSVTANKKYLWNYEVISYSDGTSTPTDPCVIGAYGQDGKTSYVHIKYSSVANPTDSQIKETPDTYIGVYTDFIESDSTHASDYTWSKWQGSDGSQGIPGANGYVHFAYSTSSDGSQDFSTHEFVGATYIGVYSDNTQSDSTDYRDYAWSLFKGADVTITSTSVEYIATTEKSNEPPQIYELIDNAGNNLISNSGSILVTNKWGTDIPDLEDGSYLWTKTTVNYSDGNSTVTYTNSKQGDAGVPGRMYFVEVDTSAVKIDSNNIITPSNIMASAYYRDGDGDRVLYSCRFVVTKTYKNGLVEDVIRATRNASQQSIGVYGEADMPAYYTVEIHKANETPTNENLLDIQTIPILIDSENLMIGARNLLKLSDTIEGCHYYGTEGSYIITNDEIDDKDVVQITSSVNSSTSKAIYYEVYTDNLLTMEIGTKLCVSMRVYARQAMTLSICLANTNGVMQTTDMQQISLYPGWNTVYTVLELDDADFELVTDSRENLLTSSNTILSTGNIGLISNVLRIMDNMNRGDYYCINYIQLEKGNRPTDFYPSPEDVMDYTDSAIEGASDELRVLISDVLNQVTTNRDRLDGLTSDTGSIAEIRRSSVLTQQQVDKVETDVETYIIQVDTVANRVVDIEKTTECFSMEDAGLRITRKISGQSEAERFSMLLSEKELGFYHGQNKVAYFNNNMLYVNDARIVNKIEIGNFAFIPRSNGNLSFKYIGEE